MSITLSIAIEDLKSGILEGSFTIEGYEEGAAWVYADLPEVRRELDGILAAIRKSCLAYSDEVGVISCVIWDDHEAIINSLAERAVPYIRREVYLRSDDLDALEEIWEKAFPGVFWDGSVLQLCVLYHRIREGGVDKACTKFYKQRLLELIGGMPRML